MLDKRHYDLLGELNDEEDVLKVFESEYIGSTSYICDVISEVADNSVPIYYSDIWGNASDISEYINEAMLQGLTENVKDIEKILQIGYYEYYYKSLSKNLDTIAFNIVVEKVNEHLNSLVEEKTDKLDLSVIEEEIESKTEDFNSSERMDNLDDIANDLINSIKEGEYNIEE